jgi:GT2 family glycosyltransferase
MTAGSGEYPSASVVIPTYNRLTDLQAVLDALQRQSVPGPHRLEVVVVDDGSSDGTWTWLQGRTGGGALVAVRQANAGPARARNRGTEAASGDIVLFLGDDTVPAAGWLEAHLEMHRVLGGEATVAGVGYTSFPDCDDSPFLRWINEYGAQFGYLLIDDAADVPFNFFYTSNISLPRRMLIELGGFREDFPAAAWEDIEFSYRASQHGFGLRYLPRARVVHNHRIRPRTFCRRQRTSGSSAAIFAHLHPQLEGFLGLGSGRRLGPLPAAQELVLQGLVSLGEGLPGVLPMWMYQRLLDVAYLRGLAEGLQSHKRR